MAKKRTPDVMDALLARLSNERKDYQRNVTKIVALAELLQKYTDGHSAAEGLLQMNPDTDSVLDKVQGDIERFLDDLVLRIQTGKRLSATTGGK